MSNDEIITLVHSTIYEHFRSEGRALTGQDIAHDVIVKLRAAFAARTRRCAHGKLFNESCEGCGYVHPRDR